ncbi:MAG: hypothetical protein R3C53_14015 [Pirellulaceae bacterium]
MSASMEVPGAKVAPKTRRVIGPRLRVLLIIVLGLFSLLMANGVYLSVITWLQHFTGEVYEDLFYQFMFLAHLVLGFILIARSSCLAFCICGLRKIDAIAARQDWLCPVGNLNCDIAVWSAADASIRV